jgi:hypothetical protein
VTIAWDGVKGKGDAGALVDRGDEGERKSLWSPPLAKKKLLSLEMRGA